MKVTFVYPDLEPHSPGWPGHFYTGIGSLSAVLKQAGHQTSLIHIAQAMTQAEFIKRIKAEGPDLIGFSSTSHMFSLVKQLASRLAESNLKIPTICGGIHPTIAPEDAIGTNGIDMICRGEGEFPVRELCEKMEKNEDISGIRNLWIKQDGDIIKNPLRPLLDDLDTLPFPDRSIFDYRSLFFERNGQGTIMVSRGCPYNCTYCCNHLLREIYGSEGKPIRFRSIDNLIAEIKEVVENYPFINNFVFGDDILFLNRKWSEEFTEKYSREVALPFSCHARADATKEATVDLLKKAGCVHIKFGVESGNEEIRSKVLNRHMSNDQILNAFNICKKAGLITQSYNIVGIPDETPETIIDTIKLNADIGVDIAQVSIYQPYPGTRLAELCRERDLLVSKNLGPDLFSSSVLKLKTVTTSQVLMFRDYFKVLMRCYQLFRKMPDGISKIFIKVLDITLSFNLTSKVLNLTYIPLNYLYRRWLIPILKAGRV